MLNTTLPKHSILSCPILGTQIIVIRDSDSDSDSEERPEDCICGLRGLEYDGPFSLCDDCDRWCHDRCLGVPGSDVLKCWRCQCAAQPVDREAVNVAADEQEESEAAKEKARVGVKRQIGSAIDGGKRKQPRAASLPLLEYEYVDGVPRTYNNTFHIYPPPNRTDHAQNGIDSTSSLRGSISPTTFDVSVDGSVSGFGLDGLDLETSVQELLSNSQRNDAILSLTGSDAQNFLDILQQIIDQTHLRSLLKLCRRCSRKLSERSGMLPKSLFIDNAQRIGDYYVSGGGCADIWKGVHEEKIVALKVLRIFSVDHAKIHKEFCREALVWRQLKHTNITPFIGVSTDIFRPHLCMISPWMVNGNVLQHLHKHPESDRVLLLQGIVEGMMYLHSMEPKIIHGDIRGANVLVNDDLQPMLADFGLAIISDTQAMTYGSDSLIKGTTRWMAPELIKPDLFEGVTGQRSPETDVYALACLSIELYTGKPPFTGYTEPAILFSVMQGQRPELPDNGIPIPPKLWDLVQLCWSHHPRARPQIVQVALSLKYLFDASAGS